MSEIQKEIFGMMALAEDLQKNAETLQQAAEDALKKLPEEVRSAVNASTQELIGKAAQNASKGLLDASEAATAAAEQIRSALRWAWLKQALWLFAVGGVIVAGLYFGTSWMISQRMDELNELKAQISAEEARKAGFELVEWGIVLPKGREIERTGRTNDGRAAVIFK